MDNKSPKNLVPAFFNDTADTYEKVVATTTFGKDRYWKKEILKEISQGNVFLDLACGTGILTRMIATKFTNAKIVGIDITKSYLETAKRNSKNYTNISFILQDAESLNLDMKFDCIVSSYIPKYCDAEILIQRCFNHLNPGGKIILHDFTYPKNIFIRKFWNMYFKILHLVGFFLPSWKESMIGLPKLIRSSSWLENYQNQMKQYNFKIKLKNLTLDSSAILIGVKSE